MTKIATVALALALSVSAALAGGPVVVMEEGQPEVVTAKPSSSAGILPILLGVVVLCAVACGGDDDVTQPDAS